MFYVENGNAFISGIFGVPLSKRFYKRAVGGGAWGNDENHHQSHAWLYETRPYKTGVCLSTSDSSTKSE